MTLTETLSCTGAPNATACGIVLAGGASRRMGALVDPRSGKAALAFAGETLLGRVCRTAAAVVRRVIVVAAPGQDLPPLEGGVEVVRDSSPGAGPLAAIRDGLRQARSTRPAPRTAVLLSCDLPLLGADVLRLLVAEAAATRARWVLPVVHGHPQVLVSALATELVEPIEDAVARGIAGPRAFLAELGHADPAAVRLVAAADLVAVDPTLESFLDVDTPEALARFGDTDSRLRDRPG
jgi:molybdopterin-guanine dinucleotide biosynthesis protein A